MDTKTLQSQQFNNTSETNSEQFKINNTSLDNYISTLFGKLVNAASASNSLPSPDEVTYQMKPKMEKHSSFLLSSVSGFLQQNGEDKKLDEMEDISEQFDSTVDLLDHYLENVDIALDELDDTKKEQKKIEEEVKNRGGVKNLKARLLRPQLGWKVDNSNTNFVPLLTEKPNAIVPLSESLKKKEDQQYNNVYSQLVTYRYGGPGIGGEPNRDSYPHPYAAELRELEFMDWQLKPPQKEILFKGLQNVNCMWVDNKEDLMYVASKLDSVTEFALDLEQHSYRTFQGFTCLMQISTREEDFLIDTLECREWMQILNSSFTNPKIVKVLHGSDNDILWLQRDFGLYIVNLFDTGQAARVLEYPSFSLAYLLKFFCGIDADKKYQLADWRVRPLPSEMVKYARQDTHYLLYIYDRIRTELFKKKGGLQNVLNVLHRSRELCLRRYEKELFTETSYLNLLNRKQVSFNQQQLNILRALYKWRDTVARKEDESTRYVLPTHMLFTICETIPTDIQKLFTCCNPVPALVRKHKTLIIKLIEAALKGAFDVVDDLISGKMEVKEEMIIESENTSSTTTSTPTVDKHLTLQSPVLTTEQLYKTARWVEQPMGVLNFTDTAMETEEIQPRYRKKDIEISQLQSSSLFGTELEGGDDEDAQKVAKIRASFSFESLTTPVKKQTDQVTSEQEVLATPDTEESKSNSQQDGDQTPPDERVPKSLTEIYKLSQKNRKRNKKKKELKHDSITDPSPAYSPESVEDSKKKSSSSTEVSSPKEFMKEIGWITTENEKRLKLSTTEEEEEKDSKKKPPRRPFKKSNSQSQFTPYNYNNPPRKFIKSRSWTSKGSQNYYGPFSGVKQPSFGKPTNGGKNTNKKRHQTYREQGGNQTW